MATPPSPKSPPRRPDSQFGLLGDKIPVPEVVERDGESVWALWSEVNRQHENGFADTVPATRAPGENPGWATTQPMPRLRSARPLPAQAQPLFTLETAMLVARRNNRVCPRPERWLELAALLHPRQTARGSQKPPAPPIGAAWKITAPLTKRLMFREHVEWAERQGVLEGLVHFMQAMPETDWLHMGED